MQPQGGYVMPNHVAAVQTIYAAFDRGDIATIIEQLDPDIEWEYDWADPLPLYRPRRGRKSVADFFKMLGDFEFLKFEPVAFLSGSDMVCVPVQLELRVKANGRLVKDLEAHLWTFGTDGKARRFRHLADTRQFARALGLSSDLAASSAAI